MIVSFKDSFFDVFNVSNGVSAHIKEFFEVDEGVRISTDNPEALIREINDCGSKNFHIINNVIIEKVEAPPSPTTPIIPPAPTPACIIDQQTIDNVKEAFDVDTTSKYEELVKEMSRLRIEMKNKVDCNIFLESLGEASIINYVKAICVVDSNLMIETRPITCEVESGSYDIGEVKYRIPLSLFSSGINEIKVSSDSGYTLPHASPPRDGWSSVCFGTAMPAILDAIAKVDVAVLATLLINFMKNGVDENDELGENVLNFREV